MLEALFGHPVQQSEVQIRNKLKSNDELVSNSKSVELSNSDTALKDLTKVCRGGEPSPPLPRAKKKKLEN